MSPLPDQALGTVSVVVSAHMQHCAMGVHASRVPSRFEEYLDMPEYSNILIKMFGLGKFPYAAYGHLEERHLEMAKTNIDKFVFVGLNEM